MHNTALLLAPGTSVAGLPDTDHALDAVLACPHCDGIGWLRQPPAAGVRLGELIPCRCTLAREAAQRRAERFRRSNLAPFARLTFAQFDPLAPGAHAAYQAARRFARQPHGWLTLLGPCGGGKTHLAAAIAHAALEQEIAAQLVVVPDLLDQLRQAVAADRADARFEAVKQAPLLVLDDLGTEQVTPWAREKLYQLINHRYNHQLATVFTSNLRLDQLDPRVASRMHDPALPATILTIAAPDYRRRTAS